jgi:hypothetical protein
MLVCIDGLVDIYLWSMLGRPEINSSMLIKLRLLENLKIFKKLIHDLSKKNKTVK